MEVDIKDTSDHFINLRNDVTLVSSRKGRNI